MLEPAQLRNVRKNLSDFFSNDFIPDFSPGHQAVYSQSPPLMTETGTTEQRTQKHNVDEADHGRIGSREVPGSGYARLTNRFTR
jgi:hypothetical protein